MSRDWIAAYTTTLRKPKYRRLTISARAALLHVWLLAGGQDPEATWRDRAELRPSHTYPAVFDTFQSASRPSSVAARPSRSRRNGSLARRV